MKHEDHYYSSSFTAHCSDCMSSSSSKSAYRRPVPQERASLWCFTLNNPTAEDRLRLDGLRLRGLVTYLCYGDEVAPTTGTPHLQGFCRSSRPLDLGKMRLILLGCHIERCYSNAAKAVAYCRKDGRFVEWGELPEGPAGKAKRDYAQIVSTCKDGKLEELDPQVLFMHYNTCKRLRQDYAVPPPDMDNTCGVWLQGPPGGGKSFHARALCAEAGSMYLKPCNKWWDSYQGQEDALLDDFDLGHKCLGHHLKIWADRYAFAAEQKGTTVQIRPKRIIVTSNYSIGEIFGEDLALTEAIKRRFKVFDVADRVVTPCL